MLQMFEDQSLILPNVLLDEQSPAPRGSKVGWMGTSILHPPKTSLGFCFLFQINKAAVGSGLRLSCTHRNKLLNRTASFIDQVGSS